MSAAGSRSLSPRAALWIGFLAGGWAATLACGAFLWFSKSGTPSLVREAAADEGDPAFGDTDGSATDGPDLIDSLFGNSPTSPNSPRSRTGIPAVSVPGGGTSDSNNRAIALSASIGGGESAVYYFDTVANRVLVYQYKGRLSSSDRPLRAGDAGGLRLLAARHIDYDLQLHGYRDLSENTRNQLRAAFEKAMGKATNAK